MFSIGYTFSHSKTKKYFQTSWSLLADHLFSDQLLVVIIWNTWKTVHETFCSTFYKDTQKTLLIFWEYFIRILAFHISFQCVHISERKSVINFQPSINCVISRLQLNLTFLKTFLLQCFSLLSYILSFEIFTYFLHFAVIFPH